MESLSDLNNRLLNKAFLQTVFSNMRQKQHTTHKRKISNLHKVVIVFNLSNVRFILLNNSFKSISFASNRDNQENSIFETIYKNGDQISKTKINIKYKTVKNRPQKGKKK